MDDPSTGKDRGHTQGPRTEDKSVRETTVGVSALWKLKLLLTLSDCTLLLLLCDDETLLKWLTLGW